MMRLLRSRLFRSLRREDGTATVEFVIFIPVLLMIFMASIESGFYMAKYVMLERGLDIVMRDVRLGKMGVVNQANLRTAICNATPILTDCANVVKIDMRPVSTANFDMPADPAKCVNRGSATQANTTFTPGSSNEIMIVRVCVVQDLMFPSTGYGLRLKKDAQGGYQMVAASFFVNEPR